MCSSAQMSTLVPDFTQRCGWPYPMARFSLPFWFYLPVSFYSHCPSHKCFLECTSQVWVCFGNCPGCLHQLKYFFSIDTHMNNFFFSHGQFFHPLESLCSNHTLTITNLSQPLSWHSRTPLHQSIFSFPQNSSLSNILYNLLMYYVYCLMPTSPFKTKAPTEWGSLLRLLTYTESLQQCPAHNRHSINSYWIKLNWK